MPKKPPVESLSRPTTIDSSTFPIPFSLSAFRNDVLVVYTAQLRVLAWMMGTETAATGEVLKIWRLIDRTIDHPLEIYNPDCSVSDIGLVWEDIAHTHFAIVLESMYQYAYYCIYDATLEPMEDETVYMWMSAVLLDMKRSYFMDEWSQGYGGEGETSAEHCLMVAELANARLLMETGEYFSGHLSVGTKGEGGGSQEGLSVRQMALLAGMEEMSIRAAANKNRVNQLVTFTDEGRTKIAYDVAKSWLLSKGRYVPVTRQHKGGMIDLSNRKFSSVHDIWGAIDDRKIFLILNGRDRSALEQRLQALNDAENVAEFDNASLAKPGFVAGLAEILEFSSEIFALRVRETLARNELARVERKLREIIVSPGTTSNLPE